MAQRKGTTGVGFRAMGAVVRNGYVTFPTFQLDGNKVKLISCFRIAPKVPDDKGKNAKDLPAGIFLPAEGQGGKGCVRKPKAGETWFICEGPKNAAAYATLGYLAVGLNGKTVKRDFLSGFVKAFKGVDVVLIPDGDLQSVEAFKKLGVALHGAAKSVRIVSLPYDDGGLRDTGGDDVRDVLKKFGTDGPQVVRDAIATAKPIDKDGEPTEPPRFLESLVTSRQLADEPADVVYLVDNIMTAGEPGTIGGPAKCLKTLTMVDLALSVASGWPFLDRFEVLRQGAVGFLSGESGRAVLRRVALRIADGLSWLPARERRVRTGLSAS